MPTPGVRPSSMISHLHQINPMSTMYCLILAVLTLVNLSPTTFATNGLVLRNPHFLGANGFNPYVGMTSFFSKPNAHTVSKVTFIRPGDFKPQGQGKTFIVLDNDGVLIKGKEDFDKARLLLTALAANQNNEVWVNTARGLKGLEPYMDIPHLNIAAEHGTVLRISPPGQGKIELRALHPSVPDLRKEMLGLVPKYKDQYGMKVFPAENLAAYMYKDEHKSTFENIVVSEVREILTRYPDYMLRLEPPGAYGEVKHKEANKGTLVAHLLQANTYTDGIAIGDQETDEGMFRAMVWANDAGLGFFHTVIVKDKILKDNPHTHTSAQYRLKTVQDVHNLLKSFL
ncbi:hypothetical protein PtA15_2A222 [Puccinia triticina]|uniref:Trehalose-phosphatase n=1 Tax=Puccinia triticina TaxID=208348 RepID=A0ABY7CB55_9BASI|nr:uncharacterized protein PtA15_2A222 [Puccinia triticina]WAQ81909.1 hypothetical protein PtA15_2A222 [Puccinia triticina]